MTKQGNDFTEKLKSNNLTETPHLRLRPLIPELDILQSLATHASATLQIYANLPSFEASLPLSTSTNFHCLVTKEGVHEWLAQGRTRQYRG